MSLKKPPAAGMIITLLLYLGMMFTACGDSRGGKGQEPTKTEDQDLAESQVTGKLILPENFPLSPEDVRILTSIDDHVVSEDGGFSVRQPGETPTMAMAFGPDDELLYFGYVNTAGDEVSNDLNALSTASALLFMETGAFTLPQEEWGHILNLIEATSEAQGLASVIDERLSLDTHALENGDSVIVAALKEARESLVPLANQRSKQTNSGDVSKRSKVTETGLADKYSSIRYFAIPPAIGVISANPQSGIRMGQNPDGDGLVITNEFRRHVWFYIYRTGYKDKSGIEHPYFIRDWVTVTDGYLSSTTGLTGSLGSAISTLWGSIPYAPVNSDPIDLITDPSDALETYYSAVVVGPGWASDIIPPEIAGHADLKSWINANGMMGALTFFKDFLIPTVFAFIPVDAVNYMTGRQLAEASFDIMGMIVSTGFDVTTAISGGDYYGALTGTITSIATNQSLQKKLGAYITAKFLKKYASVKATENIGKMVAKLNVTLKAVDLLFYGIDLSAVIKDQKAADQYAHFQIVAKSPQVHVEPDPAFVQIDDEILLNAVFTGSHSKDLKYYWKTEGIYGFLKSGTTEGKIIETTTPKVIYRSSPTSNDGDMETIEIYVYRLTSVSGGLDWIQLATNSIVVTIRDLKTEGYPGSTVGEAECIPSGEGWGWRVYVEFDKLTDPAPVSYTIHGEGFNDPYYYGNSLNATVSIGGYKVYDLGSTVRYMITGGGGSGCPDNTSMQESLNWGLGRFEGAVWTITPNY
ncbi:MAG: hypothetical protein AB1611_20560 [bacterium]